MRRGSFATGTRLLVLVGMTFLLCLLSDGRRNEWLGIPSPHPGCHHVPVTMQPKFQQPFLFMFWQCPRFSSRSECQTFQLYAETGGSVVVQTAQKTVGFSQAQFVALLSRYAWFDSGYMFCVSSRVLLDVFST